MKEIINRYAEGYASELKRQSHKTDDLRKVNHPVLFIFIGDDSFEALKEVYYTNQAKWSNHDGVMYLFTATNETFDGDNVFNFKLPEFVFEEKKSRKLLREEFYKDTDRLIELNKLIRRLNGSLTESGRYYSRFDCLNISVITRIDDPTNVLIPEISILTKKIMMESFKQVNLELYGILKEKNNSEHHYRSTAFGISFLRELHYFQSNNYSFIEQLELTEDRIPMTVELDSRKLFSLVYLLSDRDEEGKTDIENMKTNYEIISTLNLLKNRSTVKSADSPNDYYDNSAFIQGIQPSFEESAYASAGFSKVVRPNKTIALTVLYHLYKNYVEKLNKAEGINKTLIRSILNIDEDSINQKITSLVPNKNLLEESAIGLMKYPISFQQLRGLTIKNAENELHRNGCTASFAKNIIEPANRALENINVKEELSNLVRTNLVTDSKYGIYYAYILTDENDDDNGIIQELREAIKSITSEIEMVKAKLSASYDNVVENEKFKWSTLPFSENKNIDSFSKHLMTKIYGLKFEIVSLEMKLQYVKQLELTLLDLHQEYKQTIRQIEDLEGLLYQMAKNSIELETDYLSRNIFEYYQKVVLEIVKELEEKRGKDFYFEERFFGNIGELLEEDVKNFFLRLQEVCSKEVLSHIAFSKTVEDELLERSNLDVHYSNNAVLTKNGLFKELFHRLNHHSIINIDISEVTLAHRYEEKYIFGDYNSEFIQWTLNYDKHERTYKSGCVHEEKSSGIEKLNIMGGFKLTDLRYWINNYQNYEEYRGIGYDFHGVDERMLLL